MNILLTGYFGAGNLGDELMIYSTVKELSKNSNIKKISIATFQSGEIFLHSEYEIIRLGDLEYKEAKSKFAKVAKEHDIVLWVGGTCFTDEDCDGLYQYMIEAKKMGKKIGYIGVGINRQKNIKRRIKSFILINLSDIITVRDKQSLSIIRKKNILNRKKIHLTEDLVYLYFEEDIKKCINSIKQNKNLVISWRELGNYVNHDIEKLMVNNLINSIVKLNDQHKFNEIIVLPIDDTNDNYMSEYIYNTLNQLLDIKKLNIYKNISLEEKINYIKNSSINISGRLHSIFISELLGINTIAINYSDKIKRFLKSINKENDIIELKDLLNDDLNLLNYSTKEYLDNNLNFMNSLQKSKLNISILNKHIAEWGNRNE